MNASDPKTPFCIVSGDFTRTGGMDRANHALAEHLADVGHAVHLVAHRVDADLSDRPNVTFHRVPRPLNAHLLGAPLLDRAGRRVGKTVASQGGRVIVNGGNCQFGDINWVHYLHAAYAPEITGPLHRRIRWKLQHQLYRSQERRSIRSAKLVVTNSNRTRADVIQHTGVDERLVKTVHLGLDTDKFAPLSDAQRAAGRARLGWPDARPVMAFIGALGDRRKGFDTLYEAWSDLCKHSGWDARLVVIGSGAELDAWKSRASSAGLTNIEFLGFRSDVPDLLPLCDGLVAPTRYEAYGLGIAEAVSCGLPVLASRDAGVSETCPARIRPMMLLDEPNDAKALADRLRAWRNDLPGYRSAANEWASVIRLRTWSVMAEKMIEAIQFHDRLPEPCRRSVLPDGAGVSSAID